MVVGLGNPGPRYRQTRHNVGFVVVERLAADLGVGLAQSDHGARWTSIVNDELGELFLVEPQTFMNCSGEPLVGLLDDWDLPIEEVLVIHDDVDLDPGRLKLKRGGGTGGHRGLESIEEETASRDFVRLRFGVGRPRDGQDTADYVLETVSEAEWGELGGAVARARDGVLDWLRLDFEAAMKNTNTRAKKPVESAESGC